MQVGVRQHSLGHGHRLEGDVGFADEFADLLFGVGDRRAFADDHQRTLGLAQQCEGGVDGFACRRHGRGGIGGGPEHVVGLPSVQRLCHGVVGEIDVHGAWASRGGDVHGAGHHQGDVFDAVHAEGRLAEPLGVAHLVEAFVFAFVEVHDVAGGRSADHDDRESVHGGFQQGRQAVEEAWCGHGQRDRGARRDEAFRGRGVDRVLLVAHGDEAHSHVLGDACEIGDRDADHAIHVPDAVGQQRPGKVMRGVG